MSFNFNEYILQTKDQNTDSNDETSSRPSSPASSTSSSPSSSSDGSSSSSELNPKDALQSPLTGLLHFEGFSMPHIRNFGISNIDMPNLPSLPNLRYFNMPSFQPRFPDLAQNLSNNLPNLQYLTTNMPNFQIPNLSYLSQLRNVNTAVELQNMFNMFRISANLPTLPTLPNLPTLPQFPQLPQLGQFLSRGQLLKPRAELSESVRNMHRRLHDLTQRLPHDFHFREWKTEDGIDNVRIYFLLNQSLYCCDTLLNHHNRRSLINSHRNKVIIKHTNGKRNNKIKNSQPCPSTSSESNKIYGNNSGSHRSHLDQARNDVSNTQPLHPHRMLEGNIKSITCYEYDAKNSRIVYPDRANIYYFDDHPGLNKPNQNLLIKIETQCSEPKSDVRISPSDGDLVAYLCDGDIWCANLKTHQEIRLTNIQDLLNNQDIPSSNNAYLRFLDSHNSDASPLLIGRPSYIIKEEFRRHQGFWWWPDSEYQLVNESEDFVEHQILYEETDQSQVELVIVPCWDGSVEGQRFPRAGGVNPVSRLKVVRFKVSMTDSRIYDVKISDLIGHLRDIYPECEYLTRAGWVDHETVWVQMLNRRQTQLVLALVSLTGSFKSQIIYEESNDIYWVGAHDILYFLNIPRFECQPVGDKSEIAFIWSSEESGYRHLYLIRVRLENDETSPKMILKKQLTEGNWEVSEKDIWIDEENLLIYFCGLRDSPLEKHLYVLSYADCFDCGDQGYNDSHGRSKVHRLTELNFTQSTIAFNASRSIYVNIQSNITVPPFGFVNRIVPHASRSHRRDSRRLPDSRRLALLLVNSIIYPHYDSPELDHTKSLMRRPSITYDCQADLLPGLGKPELFCCQLSSGELIYGSIFKPEFMESGVRYPTVLEVYGGPEVQLVSNNFMSLRQPTRHLLSSEGYVVVLIDCRGSGRRGLNFEAHAFHRMGQVEIADQVEVLNWLAKNTEFIDLNRVAIKGWSYGGYMALMALAMYPKVFKVAIAGAPLTNWHKYDSAYSERFMGQPDENAEGYFKGNVLNYVNLFPDQDNRLLIIHGMMDENVHFSSHTVALIKSLVEAGKPYDLQIFPNERHFLTNPKSCETYMTCVLSYLQLNL